jgi:hypothetical protein
MEDLMIRPKFAITDYSPTDSGLISNALFVTPVKSMTDAIGRNTA